jgi:SAM-dependent methyltransferase
MLSNVESLSVGDWVKPGTESPDKISIAGHNDILFLLNGSNNYYEGYHQDFPSALQDAEGWLNYVRNVSKIIEILGSEFLFTVIPNKATILKEYYPLPLAEGITPILKILIEKFGNFIFSPVEELRDDPNLLSIFRRNDTHFGYYGSVLYLEKMLDRLDLGGLMLSPDTELKSLEHAGDLGSKFSPVLKERLFLPRNNIDYGILYPISNSNIRHTGSAFSTYNVNAPIKKSIVVFGNSFFEHVNSWGMSPYIAQNFERFFFVWTHEIDIDLVAHLRPDFVVLQTCERFLSRPPKVINKMFKGLEDWPDILSAAAGSELFIERENATISSVQNANISIGDSKAMNYAIKLDGGGSVSINNIPNTDMLMWSGSIMLGIVGPSSKSLPLHAMANNISCIDKYGITLSSFDFQEKINVQCISFLEWYGKSDNLIEKMRTMVGPNKWSVYKVGIDGSRILTADFGIVVPLSLKDQRFQIFCNGIEMQSDQITLDPHLALAHWFMPEGCVLGVRSTCTLNATPDYLKFSIIFPDASPEDAGDKFLPIFNYANPNLLDGLPEANRIHRVSGASANQNSFLNGGKTAAEHIKTLVVNYLGASHSPRNFLDWGVGCGRVARHLAMEEHINITGIDIDEDNLNWCKENLIGDYKVVGLIPPTPFDDNQFDVIYSCSVLSHLTEDVAHQWLSELARILKPDGVALLSFNGSSNLVSYLGRRPLELKATIGGVMFDKDINHDLDGFIPSSDYYRASFAESEWWTNVFSLHFDIVAIEPAVVSGYQDIAVLRRRR